MRIHSHFGCQQLDIDRRDGTVNGKSMQVTPRHMKQGRQSRLAQLASYMSNNQGFKMMLPGEAKCLYLHSWVDGIARACLARM